MLHAEQVSESLKQRIEHLYGQGGSLTQLEQIQFLLANNGNARPSSLFNCNCDVIGAGNSIM
jgi:hypothetical protein